MASSDCSASLRVELRLRARAPSPERVVYTQTLTLQPGTTFNRSDNLDPGFYAFEVLPLDAVAGADAQLAIALETSKGDLALALGLGLVLVTTVLLVNTLAFGVRQYALRRHG